MTKPATEARPVGRPRSEASHQAIIQATLELLAQHGLQGWSMEAVRDRAGVGKATIYRRWPSKIELVKEAMSSLHADLPAPDTGSLWTDLEELTKLAAASAQVTGVGDIVPRLMADASNDPELFEVFRERLVEPRRGVVRTILQRALERGELREDLDVELAIDFVAGPAMYRVLINGGDFDAMRTAQPQLFKLMREGIAPR